MSKNDNGLDYQSMAVTLEETFSRLEEIDEVLSRLQAVSDGLDNVRVGLKAASQSLSRTFDMVGGSEFRDGDLTPYVYDDPLAPISQ